MHDFQIEFGAILMTEFGINNIGGWDAFSHSSAGDSDDQCRGNPDIIDGNSNLDPMHIANHDQTANQDEMYMLDLGVTWDFEIQLTWKFFNSLSDLVGICFFNSLQNFVTHFST